MENTTRCAGTLRYHHIVKLFCNRISALVAPTVNGLQADCRRSEWRFSSGGVFVQQQQEGHPILGGQAEPSHAYTLEPSWEASRLGNLPEERCTEGHIPYRHCFCRIIFFYLLHYQHSATEGATVLSRMSLRHDVCMLNWLLLGDGDI